MIQLNPNFMLPRWRSMETLPEVGSWCLLIHPGYEDEVAQFDLFSVCQFIDLEGLPLPSFLADEPFAFVSINGNETWATDMFAAWLPIPDPRESDEFIEAWVERSRADEDHGDCPGCAFMDELRAADGRHEGEVDFEPEDDEPHLTHEVDDQWGSQ